MMFSIVSVAAYGASFDIMAWGAKPTEEAAPYVTSLRYGCVDLPQSCISSYKPSAGIEYYAISFAKSTDPEGNLSRAAEYSALSLSNTQLREIDIDDFVAFMEKVDVKDKGGYLSKLIDLTKSKNPKLNFGITLYEDQIQRIERGNVDIPPDARKKIDRIALYLHYRQNWGRYQQYVASVRRIFPNAKIYGGVYHYDRRDYIACRQGDSRKCDESEEKDLFQKALVLQKQLLQGGQIQGLELYPGFIGDELSWRRWSDLRICASDRVGDCVQSSKSMGETTLRMLR